MEHHGQPPAGGPPVAVAREACSHPEGSPAWARRGAPRRAWRGLRPGWLAPTWPSSSRVPVAAPPRRSAPTPVCMLRGL